MNAEVNKGGTWAGAEDQLKKYRFVPVYTRSTGAPSAGLDALKRQGALSWPNPADDREFEAALSVDPGKGAGEQRELWPGPESTVPTARENGSAPDIAAELFQAARNLLVRFLEEPKSAAEVAAALEITKRQTDLWLAELVKTGVVKKNGKPVRFFVEKTPPLSS